MSKKNAISYVKNEPPAFIQKFKEKIGYKEEPDVNAKVTLQLVEHSHSLTVTDCADSNLFFFFHVRNRIR
jgi:hypothetical protein